MIQRFLTAGLVILGAACGGDHGDDGPPGSGNDCGGFIGATCSDTEYCDYFDELCGIADGSGICRGRPELCPEVYAPVRGSDGRTYSNACFAHANGADDCGPP